MTRQTFWYAFHCADCTPPGKHIKVETTPEVFLSAHRRVCPDCLSPRFQPLFAVRGHSRNPPEAYSIRPPIFRMPGGVYWKNGVGMRVGGGMQVDISGAVFVDNIVDLEVGDDAEVTGTGVSMFGRTLNSS